MVFIAASFCTCHSLWFHLFAPENVADVVEIIHDLVTSHLGNVTYLPSMVLGSVVEKLIEVVRVGIIKPAIAARIVNIVANVLLSESDVGLFCNK